MENFNDLETDWQRETNSPFNANRERRAPARHRKAAVPSAERRTPTPKERLLLRRLNNPALAAEYINAALGAGDQDAFLLAVKSVAKAQSGGMAGLAKNIAMDRSSLVTTLSRGGNPQLRRLCAVLAASGLTLAVRPCGQPARNALHNDDPQIGRPAETAGLG